MGGVLEFPVGESLELVERRGGVEWAGAGPVD